MRVDRVGSLAGPHRHAAGPAAPPPSIRTAVGTFWKRADGRSVPRRDCRASGTRPGLLWRRKAPGPQPWRLAGRGEARVLRRMRPMVRMTAAAFRRGSGERGRGQCSGRTGGGCAPADRPNAAGWRGVGPAVGPPGGTGRRGVARPIAGAAAAARVRVWQTGRRGVGADGRWADGGEGRGAPPPGFGSLLIVVRLAQGTCDPQGASDFLRSSDDFTLPRPGLDYQDRTAGPNHAMSGMSGDRPSAIHSERMRSSTALGS